jgi:hypothetical protein
LRIRVLRFAPVRGSARPVEKVGVVPITGRGDRWSGLRPLEREAIISSVPRLSVAKLLANAPIDPEAHLDAARVERYAQMLDALPPAVVFDTPEGLLLADGYHRLAAARRLGLETVEAEMRSGSRHDALRYAAGVGAAQRGISPEEAASYIERYARDRRVPKH